MDFDVTHLTSPELPPTGEMAPEFTRPLVTKEGWHDSSLGELTESEPALLLFHPMDGSFPATYIWNEVTDRAWGERVTVVGCSPSTPYEHAAFIRDRGLGSYALFSDPGADVASQYGVAHDLDGMNGVTDARPAAVLVDGEQVVRYTWGANEYPEFPPYDAIETAIEDL